MPSFYTILCRFIMQSRALYFTYYIVNNRVETDLMVAFSDTPEKREKYIFSDNEIVAWGFFFGMVF